MPLPLQGEEVVKKSISFFLTSFRRKPESSVFGTLRTDWTPVFTEVTTKIQFLQTFESQEGDGLSRRLRPRLSAHALHRLKPAATRIKIDAIHRQSSVDINSLAA